MKQFVIACVVIGVVVGGSPAWAQGLIVNKAALQPLQSAPAQTKSRHQGMGITGLVTAAVGISLLIPHGETYNILGNEYCAKGYYTVEYGDCAADPAYRKPGLFLLGAGAAMSLYGFSRVKVSPTYKGAKATMTVAW